MHGFFILVSTFAFVYSEDVSTVSVEDPCTTAVKVGKPVKGSNTTGTLKYFFDSQLNHCFKYKTEGGDDGSNSFDSEDTCRYRCIPMDFFTCGGNAPSTGECSSFDPTAPKCPAGSFCKNGGMTSMCCDEANDKAFEREYGNPDCPKNGTVVKNKVWYGEEVLKGKQCSHKFCPEDSECQQGKWIAYCCRK